MAFAGWRSDGCLVVGVAQALWVADVLAEVGDAAVEVSWCAPADLGCAWSSGPVLLQVMGLRIIGWVRVHFVTPCRPVGGTAASISGSAVTIPGCLVCICIRASVVQGCRSVADSSAA